MPVEGVDISVHQQNEPRGDGLSFLFARATYGAGVDPMFALHIAAAKAEQLDTGSYAFLLPAAVAGVSIDDQVAVYLRVSRAAGVDYFCVDWEGEAGHAAPSKAELTRAVRLIQAAGLKAGVYASELAPYPAVGQDWRWVANYSYEPRIRWDVYQYGGTGLDRDRLKGSLDDFRKIAGKVVVPDEMKYILAYDPPKTVSAAAGTPLLDLAYQPIGTQPTPTHFTTVGLADGHTGKYVVKVNTGRYAPDGKPRATWQIAITNELPEDLPDDSAQPAQ